MSIVFLIMTFMVGVGLLAILFRVVTSRLLRNLSVFFSLCCALGFWYF